MTDDLADAPARTGGTNGDRDLALSAAIVAEGKRTCQLG